MKAGERQAMICLLRRAFLCASVSLWFASISGLAFAAETADTILVNGKIVTVDDRFTIPQALAVKGQRIAAVGEDADIRKLAAKPGEWIVALGGWSEEQFTDDPRGFPLTAHRLLSARVG